MTPEEFLATAWWGNLKPGERDLWTGEALAEIGPDDPRRETDLPLAAWRLFWSRGPTLSEHDLDTLTRGHCPICKQRGFVLGPQGGLNHMIECAELSCRMRYNVAFWSGKALTGLFLGIGPTQEPWPSEPPQ